MKMAALPVKPTIIKEEIFKLQSISHQLKLAHGGHDIEWWDEVRKSEKNPGRLVKLMKNPVVFRTLTLICQRVRARALLPTIATISTGAEISGKRMAMMRILKDQVHSTRTVLRAVARASPKLSPKVRGHPGQSPHLLHLERPFPPQRRPKFHLRRLRRSPSSTRALFDARAQYSGSFGRSIYIFWAITSVCSREIRARLISSKTVLVIFLYCQSNSY